MQRAVFCELSACPNACDDQPMRAGMTVTAVLAAVGVAAGGASRAATDGAPGASGVAFCKHAEAALIRHAGRAGLRLKSLESRSYGANWSETKKDSPFPRAFYCNFLFAPVGSGATDASPPSKLDHVDIGLMDLRASVRPRQVVAENCSYTPLPVSAQVNAVSRLTRSTILELSCNSQVRFGPMVIGDDGMRWLAYLNYSYAIRDAETFDRLNQAELVLDVLQRARFRGALPAPPKPWSNFGSPCALVLTESQPLLLTEAGREDARDCLLSADEADGIRALRRLAQVPSQHSKGGITSSMTERAHWACRVPGSKALELFAAHSWPQIVTSYQHPAPFDLRHHSTERTSPPFTPK